MRPVAPVPYGDWILERAKLRQLVPGVYRSAGSRLRNHFFLFGTHSSNYQGAVSSGKIRLNKII